jgi:hypothetical protein
MSDSGSRYQLWLKYDDWTMIDFYGNEDEAFAELEQRTGWRGWYIVKVKVVQ